MPATAQRPKVIATANSLLLVGDVTWDGIRGVPERSVWLVIERMLNEMACLVDSEEPSAETFSRFYVLPEEEYPSANGQDRHRGVRIVSLLPY